MLKQTEGSHAVAEAVALCRPQVICAYPISPQTHIVEGLSRIVKSGGLVPCEFINVESEFAAMSVAIGASATGARAYTATASQGLLYMAEAVYNAAGLGLPIVMTIANRAIGAPINIWNDHSDAMSQRDSGWIQLYARTNQEALDLHIQAFRLAEMAARFRRERLVTVPATEIALKHLGRPLPNAVLLGGFAALAELVTLEAVAHAIRDTFSGKVAEANVAAATEAFDYVKHQIQERAHAQAD